MNEVRVVTQSREERNNFLLALKKSYEVWAPIKKDLVRYEILRSPEDIYLEKNAYFPIKEHFFAKKETMFLFIGQDMKEPEITNNNKVFFGVRKCDLNAIHRQDNVYLVDGHDPYYSARRKNTLLIGYHCNTPPSKSCFCGSLDLIDYFDLMYYDKGDHYAIEVGSEEGEKLVNKYKKHFTEYHRQLTQNERKIEWSDRLNKTNLKELYNSPDWKKGVDLCLSCGACTTLCPTCYCFEIHDETVPDNPAKGERIKSWSSCMTQEFTRVAGEHIFRKDREERFKHRIYHQMDYYKDKYNTFLCTGCGRCIDGCPTRIDWVEIINEMKP